LNPPSNAKRKFDVFRDVRTISTELPLDMWTCLCLCWAAVEQTETLFLLLLSTTYPYWTWPEPHSSMTSPRVSTCVCWPCPLKSSRLMLTCCPVCASSNHGCDREPHRTRCLLLLSDDDRMCWCNPADTLTAHERSSFTTVNSRDIDSANGQSDAKNYTSKSIANNWVMTLLHINTQNVALWVAWSDTFCRQAPHSESTYPETICIHNFYCTFMFVLTI